MKKMLTIFLLLGFLMGCQAVQKAALLPVKTVTAQVDSADQIVDKTYNAQNAIYNYEWFKEQYNKILANRAQINDTVQEITGFRETYGTNATSWDSDTKQEYNRLITIKLGLIDQDEYLTAQYNARSQMADRAVFKDKLPLFVDKILW